MTDPVAPIQACPTEGTIWFSQPHMVQVEKKRYASRRSVFEWVVLWGQSGKGRNAEGAAQEKGKKRCRYKDGDIPDTFREVARYPIFPLHGENLLEKQLRFTHSSKIPALKAAK